MRLSNAIGIWIIVTALFWTATANSRAGLGTTTGRERKLWTTYRYSVIVAKIRDVREGKGEGYQAHHATLLPVATIAGTLDPSVTPSLDVRFYRSDLTSSIKGELPKDGAIVLAAVIMGRHHADETEPSDWVDSDLVAFMPNRSGLVVIKGLDDPLVAETLQKIQAVRAEEKPGPSTLPKKE
jgi:hypothetical protein